MRLTAADAQTTHDDAAARGKWLVWTLTDTALQHPGKVVAHTHEADQRGGKLLPGALVANTLVEVHAMLPTGLVRLDLTLALPRDVIDVCETENAARSMEQFRTDNASGYCYDNVNYRTILLLLLFIVSGCVTTSEVTPMELSRSGNRKLLFDLSTLGPRSTLSWWRTEDTLPRWPSA